MSPWLGAYNLPTFERNHPLNNERERESSVCRYGCVLITYNVLEKIIVFDGVSVFAEGN